MGERISLAQGLEMTINLLKSINVPVGLKEQVTDPIMNAISNLEYFISEIQKVKEKEETVDFGDLSEVKEDAANHAE